jgi:plastocyanin
LKVWKIIPCVALVISAAACSGGGSTSPTSNTGTGSTSGTGSGSGSGSGNSSVPPNTVIARAGIFFDPASLTVPVNTTVSFTFESVGHNVIFDAVNGRPADISGSNASTTITRVFTTPGTFTYHCTLHAGMNGTVVAQ